MAYVEGPDTVTGVADGGLSRSFRCSKHSTRADPSVIRQHAFDGKLFPVSRSRDVIQGLQAYPSVGACPEREDLAILNRSANAIANTMLSRGQAGVKAELVRASGFAEEPGTAGGSLSLGRHCSPPAPFRG